MTRPTYYSANDGSSFVSIVTSPTGKERQLGLLKRRETEFDLSRTTDALRRLEGEEDEEEDGKTETKWNYMSLRALLDTFTYYLAEL